MNTAKEFGIWTLPATQGAVRVAQERQFLPAHYDAAEREARRMGHDCPSWTQLIRSVARFAGNAVCSTVPPRASLICLSPAPRPGATETTEPGGWQ